MNKNLDLVAKELYAKISSYPNLVMRDAEGNDVEVEQVEGARKFNFEYEVKGRNLATVTISLNDSDENQDSFEVLISNDPAENNEYAKKLFLAFGREMREFAKQHLLTFNIHVATRSNQERDIGESIMSESKLFGTAKTSYQRIGEATLIIKHRDVVNQENPAGRAQRIESIYVENADGERFKYPQRHLNGARAMAQHVDHGGNPYDGIGQHITGLSEELGKLRMFKNYVARNEAINEAMGGVNAKVMERIESVKKEIQHLQRANYYTEFAESFEESDRKEIPEELMNDWIDRLTIRTFNEELKNVFPYIFRLVDESDIPVKELGIEDLVSEDGAEDEESEDESIIPEFAEYEQYLHRIVESEQEGVFAAENEDAIAELNELLSSQMPLGIDGTNVVQSLEGLGFDKGFLNGLKKMASDETGEGMDARPFIKEYVQQKDAALGTDILSQLTFGDAEAETAADVAPPPAEEMPPVEEPAAEMPPEELPMPPAEEPGAEMPPEELPMPPAGPVAEAIARESRGRMFDELKEFIQSMYNSDEGNFPKGVEGVKIACEKKFGDRVGPIASKIVERMSALGEMARMKQLSGMSEGKEDKIAQLKKDHATAVHWSKNETSPQKREAARQKAEKIKGHLEKQYKQGVDEGFGDSVKKGIKSIKRGLQGWDKTSVGPGGEKLGDPKAVVNRVKARSDDEIKNIHGTLNDPDKKFATRNTGFDNPSKHSPAGLQKRVVDREMKKRGLGEEGVAENYPKHQDLSGISTDKLKSYLAKQGQQQGSGEGNQIKRVRSELQRREKPVSELSKNTLGSYVKAAAKDAEDAGRDQEYHGHKNDYARGEKRQKGISKAVDRLTKEGTDSLKARAKELAPEVKSKYSSDGKKDAPRFNDANKDIARSKIEKMQGRSVSEDSDLTAMLRIAGLR